MSEWPVLMAAADGNGGVYSMWDTTVEGDTLEEAFETAKEEVQDWTREKGGFLLSRIGDEIVVHDDNNPLRCWLSGQEPPPIGGADG